MDKNKNHDNVTEPQHVADNEISVNDIDNEFVEQQEAEAAKDIADEEMNKVDALQQELDQTRIKNGGENALKGLLPVVDDFERSLEAIKSSDDAASIREGVELIYNKFVKYLEQNGVKSIDSAPGVDFDTELHEAVTMFPAPDESQKGKVIDTVQKGYTLHDKVLRHAKVVVGQ